MSNFPPPPPHHTLRLGLTLGAEARAGHSCCQGWEPLLKTTPNAKHHQLFCEFYRNHKYYIAHHFSSASPGSRGYTHSNTVIRQTRPGSASAMKIQPRVASRLGIRKDQSEKGPGLDNVWSQRVAFLVVS